MRFGPSCRTICLHLSTLFTSCLHLSSSCLAANIGNGDSNKTRLDNNYFILLSNLNFLREYGRICIQNICIESAATVPGTVDPVGKKNKLLSCLSRVAHIVLCCIKNGSVLQFIITPTTHGFNYIPPPGNMNTICRRVYSRLWTTNVYSRLTNLRTSCSKPDTRLPPLDVFVTNYMLLEPVLQVEYLALMDEIISEIL